MADICPVCKEGIGSNDHFSVEGAEGDVEVHTYCLDEFNQHPEKYGGKVETIEKTETQIKAEKEYQEQQQKFEEKSVHVKSFNMPFGDMVMFMVKWAIASIPAFIILFIIGAIFTTIFGVSLLSIFR